MRNKLFYILLLIVPIMAFCQTTTRKVIEGQVISDSLDVENIIVRNISTNLVSLTKETGEFMISATPTDTLQFTGVAVRDAQLVLDERHFKGHRLIIKLEININVLDEAIVTDLTGDLDADSKRTKTLKLNPVVDKDFFDPNDIRNYQFIERNNTLPQTESQLTGIDFKRLYKLIFKKKHKDASPGYVSPEPFSVVVMARLKEEFFIETLKIPREEVVLFLAFCDGGAATVHLLDPRQEFQLIDYLVTKSAEYFKKK